MKFSMIRKGLLIVLLLGLGVLMLNRTLSLLISNLLFFFALVDIIRLKNDNHRALYWAGFFVSLEVACRMTGGFVFWEFGKYANILLIVIGLLYNRKLSIPIAYFIYILLLLIGIAFTNIPSGESIRSAIAFNLSGPIQLGVVAIYCYQEKLSKQILLDVLFYSLIGLLPILTILFFRTPSLEEIVFGSNSNFQTSGGFGPNQVSTMLGYGIFIIVILIVEKYKITGNRILDYILLAYFVYRALLTFSRGGVLTSIIAIILFLLVYLVTNRNFGINLFRYGVLGLVFIGGLYLYTSDITGGMLDNRYTNKNARGIEKEDITAGRADIFETQLENWLINPFFGIGVGSGKYKRLNEEEGITAAAHNEVSRLLEEHGLIGLICLFILLFTAFRSIMYQPFFNWGILFAFLALWFLTISHSAMRIAFPGFMYGLSLIQIRKSL